MVVERQRFEILTDTGGNYVDTGAAFFGSVLQVRYVPDGTSPLDTGADIDITLAESGVVVASYDNIGAAAFSKVPSQPTHDTGGQEIANTPAAVVGSGDRLKVVVDAGGAAKIGVLQVWTG